MELQPSISEYVAMRIPACGEAAMYPGEGHSVVCYRYEGIIESMLKAWE